MSKSKKERFSLPPITVEPIMLVHPLSKDATINLAKRYPAFKQAHDSWKEQCRKNFKAGQEMPDFPQSKTPNLHSHRITAKAYNAMVKKIESNDSQTLLPARYNPVQVDILRHLDAIVVVPGQGKNDIKPPANWNEEKFGPWWIDNGTSEKRASGYKLADTSSVRLFHEDSIENLIADPDENTSAIVTIQGKRYVVGTGGHEGSAVFLLSKHRGNYHSIETARTKMSLAKTKGLANLVFRIEDQATVIDLPAINSWVVFNSGQVLVAGYLYAGNEQMTCSQIRKLSLSEDQTNVKFKPTDPIIGEAIPFNVLWPEIQKLEGKNGMKQLRERESGSGREYQNPAKEKTLQNSRTQLRVSPTSTTPYGLKSLQLNLVPYIKMVEIDGKIQECQGVVIGARTNDQYNITKRDMNLIEESTQPEAKIAKKKVSKSTKKAAVVQSETVTVTETQMNENTADVSENNFVNDQVAI